MSQNMPLSYVESFEFGEPPHLKNVAITPLFHASRATLGYVTLSEALHDSRIIVTEVDAGHSVPDLKVVNNADSFVLDGGGLVKAKQNRVLNTSVLLAEHSETTIPVSCTEAGRWAHKSEAFEESGYVMRRDLRANRARSVSASHGGAQKFPSDQRGVWDGTDTMAEAAAVKSATGAIADVFKAKQKEFDDYFDTFASAPNQKRLLVFIKGAAAGFDIVSCAAARVSSFSKDVKI